MKLIYLPLLCAFNYTEFVSSDNAVTHNIQNSPSLEHIENGKALYINVVQPIRDQFGEVVVTSAYRNSKLNKLVGGVVGSQHTSGQAVDIQIPKHNRYTVANWIIKHLEYDQLIIEPTWIHISYSRTSNRNQNLKYNNGNILPYYINNIANE
jgi:zinc D-Ala-D-Ala carboxypeptidase